jgi:hypothetical protein
MTRLVPFQPLKRKYTRFAIRRAMRRMRRGSGFEK